MTAPIATPGRRQRSRGQSVVEFALVLPIMLLLFAMAADFGRLFYAYVSVVNAAKEGAAYGATNPICRDASRDICTGTNNVEARVALEGSSLAGGVEATLIQCLDSSGANQNPMTLCGRDENQTYTYVVRARHTFRLVTPILGQMLGNSIVLESESRSRVLNLAFDPTPGASVDKEACLGANCTNLALTPIADENNDPQYLEVDSGEPVTYRITVRNIGGETLTSATISDDRVDLASLYGTAGCPSWPSTLAVGAVWVCTYVVAAPNTGGPPELLYDNTVTVDAAEIEPRQGAATVKIIAAPAKLAIAKNVHVYLKGGSGDGPLFGGRTEWTAYRNTRVPSVEMWFRITVTNTGGQNATTFALTDSSGSLPTNVNCPARPTILGPGASYSCRFSRIYNSNGANPPEVASGTADGGLSASATTSVTVQSCSGSDIVVPKLVGLTKTNAETAFGASPAGAGFTGSMASWQGQTNAIVATQSLDAYSCAAPGSGITVTQ